jgi:hypothetical protein
MAEDKPEEKRPDWMTSISSIVNPEDYLLGRKIDKTFELSKKEKAEKAREARIELLAQDKIKLNEDPILDLERRRRQLKLELIQNPILLKQFREKLLRGEFKNRAGQSSQTSTEVAPIAAPREDEATVKKSDNNQTNSTDRLSRTSPTRQPSPSRGRDSQSRRHHHGSSHRDPDRHERRESSRRRESDKERSKHDHRHDGRSHRNREDNSRRRHRDEDQGYRSHRDRRRSRSRSPRNSNRYSSR